MRVELTEWQKWVIVNSVPEPTAMLDLIERLNDLPEAEAEAETTIGGYWDGAAPAGPPEP